MPQFTSVFQLVQLDLNWSGSNWNESGDRVVESDRCCDHVIIQNELCRSSHRPSPLPSFPLNADVAFDKLSIFTVSPYRSSPFHHIEIFYKINVTLITYVWTILIPHPDQQNLSFHTPYMIYHYQIAPPLAHITR